MPKKTLITRAPNDVGKNVISLDRALLREATKAVPAVKFFLAVVGIAAAASLAGSLFWLRWRVAFVATMVVLIGGIIVVVFVNLVKLDKKMFLVPALVLTWLAT